MLCICQWLGYVRRDSPIHLAPFQFDKYETEGKDATDIAVTGKPRNNPPRPAM